MRVILGAIEPVGRRGTGDRFEDDLRAGIVGLWFWPPRFVDPVATDLEMTDNGLEF